MTPTPPRFWLQLALACCVSAALMWFAFIRPTSRRVGPHAPQPPAPAFQSFY